MLSNRLSSGFAGAGKRCSPSLGTFQPDTDSAPDMDKGEFPAFVQPIDGAAGETIVFAKLVERQKLHAHQIP